MAYYLDTSALVKLVVEEAESAALQLWLQSIDSTPVSSDLARTELLRAVRRTTPDRVVRAREVLDSLTVIQVSTEVFEHAALLDPTIFRSLAAVHLAAALAIGDDLESIVTYDDRLAEAARANGVAVVAPR